MVATNDLADGIETRLATIPGLHAASEWKDNVETPGAIVQLRRWVRDSFDNSYTFTFRILVIVQISDRLSQSIRAFHDYTNTSGSTSITAAIEADTTLGGVASDIETGAMEWLGDRPAGFVVWDGVTYWGGYLENIVVYACD